MKKNVILILLVVSLCVYGTALARNLDKAVVAISVDDGDRTLYNNIYPIMFFYEVPFTAYVVTDYVGTAGHVTWAQLYAMNWNGQCEIGNHTKSHMDFTGQSYATILSQIRSAQNVLINHGFLSVTSFAYPFGVSNSNVITALKTVGLTTGRGAWDENNKFNIPSSFNQFWVESVSYRTPRKHIDMKPIIDQAISVKYALSIVLHVVYPGAKGEYELDSRELEKTVAYLSLLQQQGKVDLVTVSQMAGKLQYYKNLP
jgi:peptidoglycan/xylan/chitin deacetylase (PgdA/CDA1 family)